MVINKLISTIYRTFFYLLLAFSTLFSNNAFDAIGLYEENNLTGEGTHIAILDTLARPTSSFSPINFTYCSHELLSSSGSMHGNHIATVIAGQRPHKSHDLYGQWGIAPNAHVTIFDQNDFASYDKMLNDDTVFCINISLGFKNIEEENYILNSFLPQTYKKNKIVVFSAGNIGYNLLYTTGANGAWLKKRIKAARSYPHVIIASGLVNGTSHESHLDSSSLNHISPGDLFDQPCGYLNAPATTHLPAMNTVQEVNSYLKQQGTSLSAAFVTGSLALLKEAFPELSAEALVKLVTLSAIRPHADEATLSRKHSIATGLWILEQCHFIKTTENQFAHFSPALKKHPLGFVCYELVNNKINTIINATADCLSNLMSYCNDRTEHFHRALSTLRTYRKKIKNNAKEQSERTKALIEWAEKKIKSSGTITVKILLHRFFYTVVTPFIGEIEDLLYTVDRSINFKHFESVISRIRLLNQSNKASNQLNIHRALALGQFAHRNEKTWRQFNKLSFIRHHELIDGYLNKYARIS